MRISTNSGLFSAVRSGPRIAMAEAMDFFGRTGFEAVDVNFSGAIYDGDRHEPVLDGEYRPNLDKILEAAERNGLYIAMTHLPFYRYDLADEKALARYAEVMRRAIEATAYIGAPYAVIHPYRDGGQVTRVEESIGYLGPFCDKARQLGVTLCVENMRDTSAETLAEIVDALRCAACWDVGHANLSGVDQGTAIRTLGGRLKTLHLHDNYGVSDEHSLPYLGTVDWDGILEALAATGYDGVFNYEVSATMLPLPLRRAHAEYLVDAARMMLGRA